MLIAGYYFFSLIVVRIAFMTFFSLFALQLCINSYTFFHFLPMYYAFTIFFQVNISFYYSPTHPPTNTLTRSQYHFTPSFHRLRHACAAEQHRERRVCEHPQRRRLDAAHLRHGHGQPGGSAVPAATRCGNRQTGIMCV